MVDESYAPDRDMKEFQFRQMKRVRAFVPPGLLPCDRVSLLTMSSRYGLLFVGVPSGLRVYETRSLVAANTLGGDMDTVVEDVEHVELLLPQQPHQMSLSSDELTLALCLRHAPGTAVHFYDVRALAKKGRAAPFSVLHLPGAADTCALDMKWNPAAPSVAAVCLSDGGAYVLDVSGPPCISASLPPSSSVTAICWSPKGKQLVCGKINGTMAQYTQSLQEKRQIPCAPFYAEDPVRVLDVWWVSTHVFAVVYAAADGSLDCSPQLVLITLPKKDEKTQEKFVNFSDLCFAPKSERQHRYYLHHVDEWDLIVAASSVSTDVGLLAKQKEDPTQWETWTLEDSSRAVCPVNENDDDTLPMGMAIDRSTHMLIPIGEDKSIPAAPMLVLLSTDGLLCPFYMLNKQPGAKAIVAPPQALPTHGERMAPPGGGPVAPPAAPSSTAQGPPPLTAAVAPTLKPAAAPTASTRPWPAAAAPGAGPSSPPGVRFSFSPSPSLPAPLATSKAVTSVPAEPLRQVPALAQAQAASAMGNFTLGQMLAQPRAAMNSEGPSLFSTLAASPMSSGFSMRFPGAQSQSPATRPISRPPATSIATAGQQLPRAAPPSTTASQPPANTGRPVTPARHAGPAAAVTAMKPTPQRSSDPYSVGISEEVSHFQRELDALKLRWAEDDFSVGTNEELSRMSHETQALRVYLEQIKAKTVVQHAGVSRLQTEVLQGFAELEEARSCLERRRDPAYQQLLRQRSLHPASQKQLEEIRRLHRYVTFAIQDINNILDFQWDSYVQGQKQQKKLMVPEREGLYRCLANNRALLIDYLSTVNSLCQQLQTVRARKPLSTWGGSGTLPSPGRQALPSWEDDLRTLRDALSSTHIQSPSVAPSASFSVARVAQLRNFLSKRTTIVVRSTAPANLSGSAFLSTRRTQDLDAASSVSSVVCRPCLDELDVEQFDDDDDDDDDDDGEEYDDNDEDNEDSEYDEQISRVRPSFQAPPPSAAHQPPPLTQHAPLQRTASVAPARVPGLSGAGAKGGGVATAPSATLKYGAPGSVGREGSHEIPTFVNSSKLASSATPSSDQGLGVRILLPRQAAAAAAISRNAASKPAVTSAPLTESTLKNVPKVVNVMDLSTFGAKPATTMVTSTAPANKNMAPKPSVGGGGSSAAAFSFASHSAFSGGSPFSFSTASDGAAPTGGKTATTAASTEAAAPPQPSSQAPGKAPGGDSSFGQFFDILKTANWNPGEPGKTHTGAPFSLASASNGRSLFGQPAPTTTATSAANAASAGKAAAFSFSLPVTTAAAATPTTSSAAVVVTQGPSLSSASAAVAPLPPPNTLSVGDMSPQTVPVASTAPVPSAVPVPPSASDAAPAPSFVTTTVTATTVTAAAAEEPPSAALVPCAISGAEAASPPPPAHAPQQETQDPAGVAVVGSEQPTATMTAQVFSFCMPPASASTPAPGTVAQPTATSAVAPEVPSAAAAAAVSATATTATTAAVPAAAAFGVPSAFGQPPATGVGTFATSTPLTTPQPQQPQQAAGAPAAASTTPAFGFGQPSGEAFGVAPAFGAAAPTSAPAAATTTAPTAAPPATSASPFAGTTPPVFGATSGSGVGLFGGGTGSTAGGFFGQPSAGGGGAVIVFGQAALAAAAAPVSGATTGTVATTGFGFGSTSGFGLQSSSAPAFGQPAAGGGGGAFGQPAAGSAGSLFGGTGGSGFFSGLGSKPSQEAANKNPFGQTNAGGLFAGSSNPPSLFGASAPAFCSPASGTSGFGEQKPAGAGGTFSGGASVAAQGFGAISSPCKTPGFGGPPAFGSPPSFGGSPAFGAAPAFGAVPAFGSPVQAGAAPSAPAKVFGEGTVAASSGSFGFGVVGSAPSFGNLANQANLPSFGSVSAVSGGTTTFGSAPSGFGAPTQGFGAPAQGFGAQPTTFGVFGGGGGGTGFGSTGFGSQSTPSGSAFSGWRS